MTTITGVSHVSLTVSDLARSKAWYEKLLGWPTLLEARSDQDGFDCTYLVHPDTQAVLGLTQHDSAEAGEFSPRRPGLDHLSYAVADRAELQAWAKKLDELGIANKGVEEQPIGAGLTFRDPDGVPLEFYVLGAAQES